MNDISEFEAAVIDERKATDRAKASINSGFCIPESMPCLRQGCKNEAHSIVEIVMREKSGKEQIMPLPMCDKCAGELFAAKREAESREIGRGR